MEKRKKFNLLTIDADICPKNDQPIIDKQCAGCAFYKGFEIYNGQRCIKCSAYYEEVHK